MYEKISQWYRQGLWSTAMVAQAAEKGVLSEEQCAAILK